VAEQELDLFEAAARLSTELGTSPAEVMRSEALDSNLLRRLLDYGPDRPVAQALADLPALRDRSQQSAILDAGSGHPGVDSLFDPDRDRNRANAPSLPFEIGQDPTAFPELDCLYVVLKIIWRKSLSDKWRNERLKTANRTAAERSSIAACHLE